MKIRELTYKDGRKAYATENIEVQINKQKPIKEREIDIDEKNIGKYFPQKTKKDDLKTR